MGRTRYSSSDQQRAQATWELRKRRGEIEDKHQYTPYGASEELQTNDDRELVISGPRGTGKSRAALEKLRHCIEGQPGARGLICRKTRTSLTESGLVTFERDVLGLDHPLVADGASRRFRANYHFPDGGDIVVGGLDKPGRMLSTEYDLILVQQAEEIQEREWETLLSSLRNYVLPYQQLIGDVNPAAPSHFLKQRSNVGLVRMLESRHQDNPVLWDRELENWTAKGEDYIATLDRLTGTRKERLRYGRWVQAEGVVFDEWDAAVHLIDRFEIPADWRRIRVIDFGYTHSFACLWIAIDDDGRMYRYREIYHTGRTVRVHAQQINALSVGERIEATICDHDAEDRATLEENGIPTIAAEKAVSLGIQRVQERLKDAGDGKRRLYLLRDSLVEIDPHLQEEKLPLCSEQEVDGYVWANKGTKEAPTKANDHGMDCWRYGVMYVDGFVAPAGTIVRVDTQVYKTPKRERLLGGRG